MESNVIKNTRTLNTKKTLIKDFNALGIEKGMILLVHSSLSSMGWICGGERVVIEALQEILTEDGTLIMPAHSGHLSNPEHWSNPPVPEEWWEQIREMMPPFDKQLTPTYGIGTIPESFRTYPGVFRSDHPHTSWCAWGKHAIDILAPHPLSFSLGPDSPLQRMYDLDCNVLFIGTNYDTHTSFHLAEYEKKPLTSQIVSAPILHNGQRVWKHFEEIDYDTEIFNQIGENFEKEHLVHTGFVGQAACKLFKQRTSIDFAKNFFAQLNEA